MSMSKREQLEWAIEKWADAAMSGAANPDYAAACDATVKSLQLELETGVPHCNCHFMPSDKCPSRIKSGVL